MMSRVVMGSVMPSVMGGTPPSDFGGLNPNVKVDADGVVWHMMFGQWVRDARRSPKPSPKVTAPAVQTPTNHNLGNPHEVEMSELPPTNHTLGTLHESLATYLAQNNSNNYSGGPAAQPTLGHRNVLGDATNKGTNDVAIRSKDETKTKNAMKKKQVSFDEKAKHFGAERIRTVQEHQRFERSRGLGWVVKGKTGMVVPKGMHGKSFWYPNLDPLDASEMRQERNSKHGIWELSFGKKQMKAEERQREAERKMKAEERQRELVQAQQRMLKEQERQRELVQAQQRMMKEQERQRELVQAQQRMMKEQERQKEVERKMKEQARKMMEEAKRMREERKRREERKPLIHARPGVAVKPSGARAFLLRGTGLGGGAQPAGKPTNAQQRRTGGIYFA